MGFDPRSGFGTAPFVIVGLALDVLRGPRLPKPLGQKVKKVFKLTLVAIGLFFLNFVLGASIWTGSFVTWAILTILGPGIVFVISVISPSSTSFSPSWVGNKPPAWRPEPRRNLAGSGNLLLQNDWVGNSCTTGSPLLGCWMVRVAVSQGFRMFRPRIPGRVVQTRQSPSTLAAPHCGRLHTFLRW